LKNSILFIALLLISLSCFPNLFRVGPTRSYLSPRALYLASVVANGDSIEIDAADYLGADCLANWSVSNLYIKGVGGRPHMIANGQNIGGKSIWITSGNDITIENIEFSGCTVPDANGAGIRAEGLNLTIRSCYFHNNENGILTNNTNAGNLLVEYSEFAYNGAGDGLSHNIYVGHISKLTFQYNYSHHANIGHNLKSRANENIILYNRIMDETTGNSSRLIDLPNGGFSLLMGNLLMQGNNAQNNNMVGYGLEGLSNPRTELYFVNNTMVNKRIASCRFLQIQSGTTVAQVINNIFAGTGTIIDGITTTMSNNLIDPNINNILFTDEANYNYTLSSVSPAIDGGLVLGSVSGYSLVPDKAYQHPVFFAVRIPNGNIDIGAYEYSSTILPVKWLYFQLKKIEKGIEIAWATSAEDNSKQFDIEVSGDGINFSSIGAVPASGNASQIKTYRYVNCCPIQGKQFYRVKSIDNDNRFEYSVVKSISLVSSSNLSVYPNPVCSGLVRMKWSSALDKDDIICLLNPTGISLKQIPVKAGTINLSIDLADLPAGIYFVNLSNSNTKPKILIKH
jgi:hypothetical protein